MGFLSEELDKKINKIAEKRAEKIAGKSIFSVKEILDSMDRSRKLLERQSNKWWRKNLNLDEENHY